MTTGGPSARWMTTWRRVLASRALRQQVYARRGEPMLDLTEEVLAMEVVRLRRALSEQGSFW